MEATDQSPVSSFLADLGGPTKVAEELREKPGTVRMWKLRGRIPRASWPDLIQAFPDRVDLNTLLKVERAA